MTRHEKIREARRLRDLGWTAPAIGQELGVNESTVRNWYLGGECEDCGVPIVYDSASYDPPRRCRPCDRASKEAQHGSCSKYSTGCRCDDCTRANREYQRTLKGRPPRTHGHSGYRNYGCRCQTCKDGNLAYMRSIEWKHQRAWAARIRGTPPPRHGTFVGYSKYACRCDECRRANRDHSREWRRRRRERQAA